MNFDWSTSFHSKVLGAARHLSAKLGVKWAIIRIFKLELLGMIRINIVAKILGALLGISFLAKCPEVSLAGLRVAYPGER